ncbi:PREDICTED: uncharacterized protein LOC109188004 [Ipomoea nil]|uniref:uncharacterized protein LOC109188004 n=1 Tax=Ipomoea nil TaxID=35883 RepID=UPI00090128C6|nr:PREDICTED: uncharacterized protein LOC109188004 [Ipomoea nil]XP_019194006.1 PREDICTED: uncharacterized protein LOC109188004 [Ipomoea nil]
MDSPQSVVSPYKESAFLTQPEKQKIDFLKDTGDRKGDVAADNFIGVLDVYVHQARDIHNICIYHKQDVYAKLCLTSDPESALPTKIINGGGQNPVFNDNLQLNVRTTECSLKCEIWMMSRVKNYLEDQLLGFALVPLSKVLVENGKLEQEFPLSSTDLFHSPAGFVKLSLSYTGESPEVISIPFLPEPTVTDKTLQDTQVPEFLPCEMEKIEFPDPKIVCENDLMVSEYYGIQSSNLETQSSDSLVSSDTENQPGSDVNVEEILPAGPDSHHYKKQDSPPSSVSTNESPLASLPASSQSSATPQGSKFPNDEYVSPPKECPEEKKLETKPLVTVNIEPEPQVVQQDIVDMYMKSMQQFTESLAKMKLPLDIDSGTTSSGNSTSEKSQTPKSAGSRVFYGSRAFF